MLFFCSVRTDYDGEFGGSYAKLMLAPSSVRIGFIVRDEWGIAHTRYTANDHTPAVRKLLINEAGMGLVGLLPAPRLPTLN